MKVKFTLTIGAKTRSGMEILHGVESAEEVRTLLVEHLKEFLDEANEAGGDEDEEDEDE